jgi:hypothetical protein
VGRGFGITKQYDIVFAPFVVDNCGNCRQWDLFEMSS